MSHDLTARQREVLEMIRSYLAANHRPPTVREIGEHFRISSTNGVRAILLALEKKGRLTRSPHLSRGILPVEEPEGASSAAEPENVLEIPLLGRVAAGSPILAEETAGEMFSVPRGWVPHGGKCFALKVRGESMREAGIMNGDTIVAARTAEVCNGDIVVALLGDEATVKSYYRTSSEIELRPHNSEFQPIHVSASSPEFRVLGKVVAVWRGYAF